MKKRVLSMLLAAILLMSVITGCSQPGGESAGADASAPAAEASTEQQPKDTHINVALFTYIEGMDPAIDWCGWNLTRCGVGETLITVNEKMEFEGQLADSWEQLDDLTYKFHIRQGVQFSNGTALTPEIVKASIERTVATNSRGESIKLASAEVEGEYLICKTTEPFSAFLANITEPMFVIVDTTADTSDYASKPVCTGPYSVEEYVSEERIELASNESYWGGAPEIKTITVRNIGSDSKADSILAGDIDLAQGPAATTLARIEGNTQAIEAVKVTGTRENDMLLNCREGSPLSDMLLRQALSYGVDREVIAKVAGNGYATALGTAFPSTVGYNSDKVNGQTYDLEKAKALLAQAGYTDSDGDGIVEKDGSKLVLTISLVSSAFPIVSEALQDMWQAMGVGIEIEMLENIKDKRASGEFDILVSAGWQTVNAGDGQKYLMERWGTEGTDNYGKYSSPAFDAVMGKLDLAFDQQERLDCFVEAQQILADESPCVWMYANDNVTLVNTNKVANVTIFPIDYYLITNELKLPA
ncbi:ABC transporter substrate-binding protein [Oscillospiraceae bacterium MB08-C2-2]|nr:ABC transporter substrate-binding protein [Oscillospiraceae bacterium MB08-C2-2]